MLRLGITISKGLDILLLIILWILWTPILLLVLIFYTFRLMVHLLARIFRPDLIPIDNAVDNIIKEFPSKSNAVLNCCQVWDLQGKLELSVFRKQFYEKFLSTPELRERYKNFYCYFVKWGVYCFKKAADEVNLMERIREESLIVKSDKDFEKFVGSWMETNDYGENPNWEALLLHTQTGLRNSDEKTTLLLKIDHGLCDGYTFLHIVERLSGIKSPYLVRDESISFWQKVEIFLTLPRRTVDIIGTLLKTQGLPWGDRKAKDLGMYLSFATLDLEKLKMARRLAKCHFNTVLGVIQALSVKKFLLKKGRIGSPAELPEYTYVPSPTGWPNHPAMTKGTMGNHLSLGMFQVKLREDDPSVTLQKGEQNFIKMQKDRIPEVMYLFYFKLLWGIPPVLMTSFKSLFVQIGILSKISHGFSPLMLSQEPYQLLGIPVEHIYLPLQPLSVVPCIRLLTIPVSNGGRLDISIGGRNDTFESQEDLDYFTQVLMKQSLDELLESMMKGLKRDNEGQEKLTDLILPPVNGVDVNETTLRLRQ